MIDSRRLERDVVKIKPPLVIDEGEVQTVLGVLADCLKAVFPTR